MSRMRSCSWQYDGTKRGLHLSFLILGCGRVGEKCGRETRENIERGGYARVAVRKLSTPFTVNVTQVPARLFSDSSGRDTCVISNDIVFNIFMIVSN